MSHGLGISGILRSPLKIRFYFHYSVEWLSMASLHRLQPCFTLSNLCSFLEPWDKMLWAPQFYIFCTCKTSVTCVTLSDCAASSRWSLVPWSTDLYAFHTYCSTKLPEVIVFKQGTPQLRLSFQINCIFTNWKLWWVRFYFKGIFPTVSRESFSLIVREPLFKQVFYF